MFEEHEVRDRVRQLVKAAGGVRALARELGLCRSYVGAVCTGQRALTLPFLKALGLRKVVLFEPISPLLDEAGLRQLLRLLVRKRGCDRASFRRHRSWLAYARGVLAGRCSAGPAVLRPLGLQRVVRYVPAGSSP
jgi:hypothetical protein